MEEELLRLFYSLPEDKQQMYLDYLKQLISEEDEEQ